MKQFQIVIQGNHEKLIAQTFDGVKVIEEKLRGVQARVKNVYGRARCTHCHQMQVVAKKACKQN